MRRGGASYEKGRASYEKGRASYEKGDGGYNEPNMPSSLVPKSIPNNECYTHTCIHTPMLL